MDKNVFDLRYVSLFGSNSSFGQPSSKRMVYVEVLIGCTFGVFFILLSWGFILVCLCLSRYERQWTVMRRQSIKDIKKMIKKEFRNPESKLTIVKANKLSSSTGSNQNQTESFQKVTKTSQASHIEMPIEKPNGEIVEVGVKRKCVTEVIEPKEKKKRTQRSDASVLKRPMKK